jgi:uncharacterized protein (DUF3084 family)
MTPDWITALGAVAASVLAAPVVKKGWDFLLDRAERRAVAQGEDRRRLHGEIAELREELQTAHLEIRALASEVAGLRVERQSLGVLQEDLRARVAENHRLVRLCYRHGIDPWGEDPTAPPSPVGPDPA